MVSDKLLFFSGLLLVLALTLGLAVPVYASGEEDERDDSEFIEFEELEDRFIFRDARGRIVIVDDGDVTILRDPRFRRFFPRFRNPRLLGDRFFFGREDD